MRNTSGAEGAGKPWYLSKTYWFNLFVAIMPLLGFLSGQFGLDLSGLTEEEIQGYAASWVAVLGVGNMLLRHLTKGPSRLPGTGDGLQASPIASVAAFLMVAILLSGCLASMKAETPAQRVFALQADYNAALSAAVAYESLPRCEETGGALCSDVGVVGAIRGADNLAALALASAQNIVRAPGATDNAVNLAIVSAREAVDLLVALLIEKEIEL